MIWAAVQAKIRQDGALRVACEGAFVVVQTAGWAVMLGATAALTLAVCVPLVIADEVARSVRRGCDGGCGSRSMDDCGHGGRPS